MPTGVLLRAEASRLTVAAVKHYIASRESRALPQLHTSFALPLQNPLASRIDLLWCIILSGWPYNTFNMFIMRTLLLGCIKRLCTASCAFPVRQFYNLIRFSSSVNPHILVLRWKVAMNKGQFSAFPSNFGRSRVIACRAATFSWFRGFSPRRFLVSAIVRDSDGAWRYTTGAST